MTKNYALPGLFLLAAAVSLPAHARVLPPATGIPIIRAPTYNVELLDMGGRAFRTYQHRGRAYVLGGEDQRYIVRVSNPTAHRVEAVVSVDGLDAIDGRPANFTEKRGYIVPAYGEIRIEGFRISAAEVAAFRFSSVGESYAGRKGKARHVGVIGIAVFNEQAPAQVYIPVPEPRLHPGETSKDSAAPERQAPGRAAGKAAPGALSQGDGDNRSDRPGLGTRFGERRFSQVSLTRFERATSVPSAIIALRYNDRAGLLALGIPLEPSISGADIELRETANPFPGSPYASPPDDWR